MKSLNMLLFIYCIPFVLFAQQNGNEVNGRGLSFIPDNSFENSSFTDWKNVGEINWKTKNGVISGKSKNDSSEGLFISNLSFQDVGMHTLFRCEKETELGFLFRMEKTDVGIQGIMISIKDDQQNAYHIAFDKEGKELHREVLRSVRGIIRKAPPIDPNQKNRQGSRRRPSNTSLNLPLKRPSTDYRPEEWNQIEVFLDLDIIRSFLNDGGPSGRAVDKLGNGFGVVGFYMKGKGEVALKDLGFKDLGMRFTPIEASSKRFKTQQISDMFYSWSSTAADFNNDGFTDVGSGPYIYFGPSYTSYREIYPAFSYNPHKEFPITNCQYSFDFNQDGWPDIFTSLPHATIYMNPKGKSKRWDKHVVVPTVQSEITVFKDIDGDGVPELVYGANKALHFAKFDPQNPTQPWKIYNVSESGYMTAHGIGTGDINGDGRQDIINPNGWWEQPAKIDSTKSWEYHSVAFARYGHRSSGNGGSVMAVYDVNGNGLNDVVTSLNAHGFGLAWFEQKKNEDGEISFQRHMISDDFSTENSGDVTFSQLHGSTFSDIDGDGIKDFIVGKRYWSHLDNYFDPDPYGAPVLYCYKVVRDSKADGGARFVPELVHNRSGSGSDVLASDLDKDGNMDIITSTDRGTFIFWNLGKNQE